MSAIEKTAIVFGVVVLIATLIAIVVGWSRERQRIAARFAERKAATR